MGAPKGKGKASAGKGKGKSGAKGWTQAEKGGGKGKGRWTKVNPTVLVTGASHFIAGHVIQKLSDQNYKVRGTVTSLESAASKALKKRFPDLELFEADLLHGNAGLEKGMEGCKFVVHTTSAFQLATEDPQRDLVDPAVKGTEAVMQAALKAGVERVVLTSSVAAVGPPQEWVTDPSKADKEKVFTEEDWNTTSTLQAGPYRLAKRLAEEKATEIAKANPSLQLTVICPGFLIGPMLIDQADNESSKFIKSVLDGSMKETGCDGGWAYGIADVRDVATAHVLALESAEAAGKRFLVSSETGYGILELVDMIRDRFKAYPLPTEGKEVLYKARYSNELAKTLLKLRMRPVEVSMRDMASACINQGIVAKKIVLKPTTFSKVGDLNPDSKGVNLLVKVVSVTKDEADAARATVVAGDDSGVVTIALLGDEVNAVAQDATVEIRNAFVKMAKGFIRLQVGKWGKISKHEGDTQVVAKTGKDMSAVEYELVNT